MSELKIFLFKLLGIFAFAPFGGWLLLRFIEISEKSWKSGDRRKRWMILSGVFIILAGIAGWLQ